MAQAIRRSLPTAGVPSSRLGHSMWVPWWTKGVWVGFPRALYRFPPTTNFVPTFPYIHLIPFVSFHFIISCDSAISDLRRRNFIAYHPSIRPCVGHELRMFFYKIFGLEKSTRISINNEEISFSLRCGYKSLSLMPLIWNRNVLSVLIRNLLASISQ